MTTCLECQAGQMHRHYVTYFTWLGNELITVPDFPSWVCDVCGRREYDAQALNRLVLLLSPNAGKPAKKKRMQNPARPPAKTQPPNPDI
ncbi:MAG: YgiT-type zinc finger protein [Anaerolineaceae bacterium]|nr:YgiT-type zinc finger protein [Anaerolineaceae bacterium]